MGVYAELVSLLEQAPSMAGVDIRFGEETNFDLNVSLPRITIYPTTGVIGAGVGMTPRNAINVNTNMVWDIDEILQVHCWAKSKLQKPTILDHYDECELLGQNVLRAFRYQRYHFQPDVGPGFYINITPSRTFWVIDEGKTKQGRAFVVELSLKRQVVDDTPVDAIIKSVQLSENLQ